MIKRAGSIHVIVKKIVQHNIIGNILPVDVMNFLTIIKCQHGHQWDSQLWSDPTSHCISHQAFVENENPFLVHSNIIKCTSLMIGSIWVGGKQ